MFIKAWRLGLVCVIYILHFNVMCGQRRSYPWHIFHNNNRRILNGAEAARTRPYMVWLRPDSDCEHPNWLCGGVIISEYFVLTSAACIEDVKRFYVVSGTYRWVPLSDDTNECVKNGAVKAVWKCVPKSYVFDGKLFENIRWMMYDLAVVRVEEPFNFAKRVRGCDFIPAPIRYNNFDENLEKPGTVGSTAGWGATYSFAAKIQERVEDEGEKKEEGKDEAEKTRRSGEDDLPKTTTKAISTAMGNSPVLLETDVLLISKKKCKARWPAQHHAIIDQHMICAKSTDTKALGSMCLENDLNCKDLVYEDYEEEEEGEGTKPPGGAEEIPGSQEEVTEKVTTEAQEENTENSRRVLEHVVDVHGPRHDFEDGRRAAKAGSNYGGFCENDHGGPLVVGRGKEAVVVGIISACMSKPGTHSCYGPFLFTSIYKYRHLIACATEKVDGAQQPSHACRNALRASRTDLKRTRYDWTSSKRFLSKEDIVNTNSGNSNKNVKPSNAAVSHETNVSRRKEDDKNKQVDSGEGFNSSNEEKVKTKPSRRSHYEGVREITDDGKPVPGDDIALNPNAHEPKDWRANRKRARLNRARAALGFPVTNTEGGGSTLPSITTTEKYFPVVTYEADGPENLHDVHAENEPKTIRRRSRKQMVTSRYEYY